jgi:predicted permease
MVLILLTWPVGSGIGRLMRLRDGDLGAFIGSSMFANIGITYGTFLCFALLGERGAALGYLYGVSYMPTFFTLGFFVASRHSQGPTPTPWQTLRETLRRPESRNPITAMAIGLLLFATGLPRPHALGTVVDVVVPVATFLYLFAIGLSLSPRAMIAHWKPALAMHAVKFLAVPALGLTLAYAVGLQHSEHADLLRIMFIEAGTPAAIMSLVLAQVKRLNVDLANACWLATNLTAIALAPLWLYIASVL